MNQMVCEGLVALLLECVTGESTIYAKVAYIMKCNSKISCIIAWIIGFFIHLNVIPKGMLYIKNIKFTHTVAKFRHLFIFSLI